MGDFNGQWIEICTAGVQGVDSEGGRHNIDLSFLERVVSNHNVAVHEPPVVVGHPQTNLPAYGWGKELRLNGGKLEAKLGQVDPDFEELVRSGRLKKRSASFYVDSETAPGRRAPQLRHIGFLGAEPPHVKGLKDIQFSDGARAITFSEGGDEVIDEDKVTKGVGDRLMEYLKSVFEKKDGPQPASASFSEADVRKMVTEAVASSTVSFTEELKQVKAENKGLQERLAGIGHDATRSRIIAFTERLGAARFPPAFRRLGVIEFMEKLAAVEPKVQIISFAEGKETKREATMLEFFESFVEELGPFIQFGESFGGLRDLGDKNVMPVVDADRMNHLREIGGLPVKELKPN